MINQVMPSVFLPLHMFLLSFRNGQLFLTRNRQVLCFLRPWDDIQTQTYTVWYEYIIIKVLVVCRQLSMYSNCQMTTGSRKYFLPSDKNCRLLGLVEQVREDHRHKHWTAFLYFIYEHESFTEKIFKTGSV